MDITLTPFFTQIINSMARPSELPVTMTADDLYERAHKNTDFETIEKGLIDHPEWLTQIPSPSRWGILHQVVFHGDVDQLNRLLVLQTQNPNFLLLSKTRDNKTVLDIAEEAMRKNESMYRRIERLAMMDELINSAKAGNWEACRLTLQRMPGIINEKTSLSTILFHSSNCVRR